MTAPRFIPLRLALLATLIGAGPLLAGPPWISIEYPANPYDAATRGALLTLHTYHHGDPLGATVSARAEGMVGGVRRTVQLTVRPTGRVGVWAVSGSLPTGAAWVISCTMTTPGGGGSATALLALDADGRVAALDVPVTHRDGWTIPREVTAGDINAMLAATVAAARAPTTAPAAMSRR